MADSPMTWFPRIRTLGTIDLDRNLWTDYGAEAASGAFSFFLFELSFAEIGGTKSLLIHPVRRTDEMVGADVDAEFTVFTQLAVNLDRSCRQFAVSLSLIRI